MVVIVMLLVADKAAALTGLRVGLRRGRKIYSGEKVMCGGIDAKVSNRI